MNHIVIIGFMGSGKTRVGKRLSQDFGIPFVDVDRAIVKRMGMSVKEVFQRFGEPFYRALETMTIKELVEDTEQKVISLGAGLPVQEQNQSIIPELGTVIYIRGSFSTLKKRLEDTNNPIMDEDDQEEKIRRMIRQRDPVYEKFADIVVVTGIQPFDGLVQEIKEKLEALGGKKRSELPGLLEKEDKEKEAGEKETAPDQAGKKGKPRSKASKKDVPEEAASEAASKEGSKESSKESSQEDKAVNKEKPEKEKAAKDKASKDKAAKEKNVKEKTTKEKTPKAKTTKEKKAKDKAEDPKTKSEEQMSEETGKTGKAKDTAKAHKTEKKKSETEKSGKGKTSKSKGEKNKS